jgi:hypothetical protein
MGGAAPAEASAAQFAEEREVRIPFFNLGRFRTFLATDNETLYVRASSRRWYKVTTLGPCPDLVWAHRIGIDNVGSTPWLDRFSMLIVEDSRCPVRSVVESGEPPKRERRNRR